MKEKKEFKSELCEKVEKFQKEISPLFAEEKEDSDRAIILIAIDDVDDGKNIATQGIILGKHSTLCAGIARAMKNNEKFSSVLDDSVGFYHFLKDPLKAVKNMINNL